MVNTRAALQDIGKDLEESIDETKTRPRAQLSPVASPQDIGRRPLRNFARMEISQVEPDPDQPRKQFSEEEIQRLADSLKQQGQLQPIRVRWSSERKEG